MVTLNAAEVEAVQHELMASEGMRQAAVLDALPAHIALLDGDGVVVSVNAAWRRFATANSSGTAARAIGRNYLEVCANAIGPDASEIHATGKGIRSVLRGEEKSFSIEYACHSSTEQRWFLMTVTPLAEGRMDGAVVMHLDVTRRKRAEHAKEQALVRLNEAQRVGRIGDWDITLGDQTITWSPQVYEIVGRDPSLGPPGNYDDHAELYDAPSRVAMQQGVGLAISTGEAQEYELVLPRPNGRSVHVHAVAVPVKDESGRVYRIHGTIQDVTAQKHAELAFAELSERTQKRERTLSVVLSSIKDFAYIVDRQRRLLFANQALLDLWGTTLESVAGKTFLELGYPEAVTARLQAQVQDVLDTRVTITDETAYDSKVYEYVLSPVLTADGLAEFVVGSTRDVTERKRVEDELRARDRRFHQLADHISDVFWVRSADMRELHYISPGFERIWGRSIASMQANPERWSSFIVPEDRERVRKSFMGLTTDTASIDEEYRIARPDGEIRWVRARGVQVRDEQGKLIRNIGIATDITEKQHAVDALRQSQKRLRDVFDGLGASMFVGLLTPDGVLVEINRSPLEAAGLKAEDVLGKPLDETHWWSYSPEAQLQLREAIKRAAAGEASRYDVRMRGAGDAIIDIDFSLEPLRDDSGAIAFLVSSANVITERKVAEEALRQAHKMEAVGQLAAGVAHEFNNLMQALMSMSTMMRLLAPDPATAKIGTDMETLLKRGSGLTQQLLLFSRHRPIEKVDLDMGEQLQKAGDFLRHLIPETIAIAVEIADTPLNVQGDAGQIHQVLLNLAINARDAMPEGGTLTLRAGRAGNEVFHEVEDTGHGMNAETQHHLFEPFFTTKGPAKGTGLGLAVAHGIVQQHGGRIEVHTTLGNGSRFRVFFPASIREGARAAEPVAVPITRGGGTQLLLVEDDPSVREGLSVLLEWIGYKVTTASTGEEAIALHMDPPPQLLLSDVTLPGVGGPVTATRLRERWPALKVVLMSGYAEETMRANASREGWHFLQKPFELADLEQKLRVALDPAAHPPS